MLLAEEFTGARWAAEAYDFGMLLVFLPLVAVAGGGRWPWWVMFPVILVPIAGKTFVNVVMEGGRWPMTAGIATLLVLPIFITAAMGEWLLRGTKRPGVLSGEWLGKALLFTSCAHFALNFAFFEFPWPWVAWTPRTPNGLVFAGCLGSLAWIATRRHAAGQR